MENFILNYGILGLGFVILLDDIGFPFFPASALLFTAAIFSGSHPDQISVWQVYTLALSIPPIGNSVLFFWGRHGARNWLNTHGHKIFLPTKRMQKADKIFLKYGERAVLFAAMFTTIRCVVSVIAGASKMNPAKFYIYHFLGVLVWASVVTWLGYFLGDDLWVLVQRDYKKVLLILFGGFVLWWIGNYLRKKYFSSKP